MMRNPPSSFERDATTTTTTANSNDNHSNNNSDWKPRLVLIDFGLAGTAGSKGGVSHEERAVDLYVLERAFQATHPGSADLVREVMRSYKGRCNTSDAVLQRLAQVRMRGRKRECFG
mmetsp:Transcript_17244/g.38174  ORF Transcript_17244/g.38174 Transcript_17244/m.38174 type:complete len:117 (+) Transcript_17244:1-351(+)